MIQLLGAVLAIGLTGAVISMSLTYVNPAMAHAHGLSNRFEKSFLELKQGRDDYVVVHAVEPNALPDIAPSFVFLPPAPQGMSWSLGAGGVGNTGRYFCLSGEASPVTLKAIERLGTVFSPQAYFVNGSCGSLSSNFPTTEGAKVTVAATLWVSAYL